MSDLIKRAAVVAGASGATIKVSGTIDDDLSISHPVTITTWPGGPAVSPGVLDGTASGTVVIVNLGLPESFSTT